MLNSFIQRSYTEKINKNGKYERENEKNFEAINNLNEYWKHSNKHRNNRCIEFVITNMWKIEEKVIIAREIGKFKTNNLNFRM